MRTRDRLETLSTTARVAVAALVAVAAPGPAIAQCPVASTSALAETSATFSEPSPQNNLFCNGVIGVDCGGFNPGFLLDLNLTGRFDVDLVCTSTLAGSPHGRVCAVDAACGAVGFTHPAGQHTVRVAGDFSSTSLKLVTVSTDDADCHYETTVSCTGFWGAAFDCFPLNLTHNGQGKDPVASPAAGANCPAGEYRAGDAVTLTAAPDPGWQVERWQGTNNDSSTASTNGLTIADRAETVTVFYKMAPPVCYQLSLNKSGEGDRPTASPKQSPGCNAGFYNPGESIDLTAKPAPRWEVERWTGTDRNSATTATNVATMANSDHNVVVVYRPSFFDSGFERLDFADWNDHFCPGCNSFSGSLGKGQTVSPQSTGYETSRPGLHRGVVESGGEVVLRLELLGWDGSAWRTVAESLGAGRAELSHHGPPGRYQWRLGAVAGEGAYELAVESPAAARLGNRLIQSDAAALHGDFGVESIYAGGQKGKTYLRNDSPGVGDGESDYRVGFQIRPNAGLFLKGKNHAILEARQGRSRKVFELFLRRAGSGRFAFQVRPRSGGKKGKKSPPIVIDANRWTEVELRWKAASSVNRQDGFLALFKDGVEEWRVSLDNAADRVDAVYLGQTTPGKTPSAGTVWFDDFESSWKNE